MQCKGKDKDKANLFVQIWKNPQALWSSENQNAEQCVQNVECGTYKMYTWEEGDSLSLK